MGGMTLDLTSNTYIHFLFFLTGILIIVYERHPGPVGSALGHIPQFRVSSSK